MHPVIAYCLMCSKDNKSYLYQHPIVDGFLYQFVDFRTDRYKKVRFHDGFLKTGYLIAVVEDKSCPSNAVFADATEPYEGKTKTELIDEVRDKLQDIENIVSWLQKYRKEDYRVLDLQTAVISIDRVLDSYLMDSVEP